MEVTRMESVNMTIRMDKELKRQAEDLFDELGMNMTTALNVFLRQAVREQRIPFTISRDVPNSATLEALAEVRRMKQNPQLGKTYADVDEMFEELLQ